MSDTPQGLGWWQASDGKWYPPEQAPGAGAQATTPPPTPSAPQGPPATPPPTPTPPPTSPPTPPPVSPSASGPAPYQPPSAGAPQAQKPAAPGEAFNWGWLKFQQNIGDIIIVAIVVFLAFLILTVLTWFFLVGTIWASADSYHCTTDQFTGRVSCSGGGGGAGFLAVVLGIALYWLLIVFLTFLAEMMFIRGGLLISYGEKLEVRKMLSTESMGSYVVASLIVAIAAFIGFWFCILPGIIVLFFAQFTGFFILDKKMSALDGIKASFQLVNRHLGTLIGFSIGCYIAFALGYFLCGLGLIVAVPVIAIASTFMYRRLQGEPVAA